MLGLSLFILFNLFINVSVKENFDLCRECTCDFGSRSLLCESTVPWDFADEGGKIYNSEFKRLTYSPTECFTDFKPELYFPNLKQFTTSCCANLHEKINKFQTTCQLKKPDFLDNNKDDSTLGWGFYVTIIFGFTMIISCSIYFFKIGYKKQELPQIIDLQLQQRQRPPRPPPIIFRSEMVIDLQ